MSYILIDAGNSCLKIAVQDDLCVKETEYTILGYDNLHDDLYNEVSDQFPSGVIVSNVSNPIIYHIISDVAFKLWHIEPVQAVVEQDKYGITTRYINHRLLGIDRWLSLIAARDEFHNTLCVVDCGTAITIDVLTGEGMHVGGLITPGLTTSRKALNLQANNLPLVENQVENNNNKSSFLAITTQDAILGGTLYQISAYIERIVAEIKEEFGDDIHCIITGGDAEQIQALSMHHFHFREALVLDGLKIIARELFGEECL